MPVAGVGPYYAPPTPTAVKCAPCCRETLFTVKPVRVTRVGFIRVTLTGCISCRTGGFHGRKCTHCAPLHFPAGGWGGTIRPKKPACLCLVFIDRQPDWIPAGHFTLKQQTNELSLLHAAAVRLTVALPCFPLSRSTPFPSASHLLLSCNLFHPHRTRSGVSIPLFAFSPPHAFRCSLN